MLKHLHEINKQFIIYQTSKLGKLYAKNKHGLKFIIYIIKNKYIYATYIKI